MDNKTLKEDMAILSSLCSDIMNFSQNIIIANRKKSIENNKSLLHTPSAS